MGAEPAPIAARIAPLGFAVLGYAFSESIDEAGGTAARITLVTVVLVTAALIVRSRLVRGR